MLISLLLLWTVCENQKIDCWIVGKFNFNIHANDLQLPQQSKKFKNTRKIRINGITAYIRCNWNNISGNSFKTTTNSTIFGIVSVSIISRNSTPQKVKCNLIYEFKAYIETAVLKLIKWHTIFKYKWNRVNYR